MTDEPIVSKLAPWTPVFSLMSLIISSLLSIIMAIAGFQVSRMYIVDDRQEEAIQISKLERVQMRSDISQNNAAIVSIRGDLGAIQITLKQIEERLIRAEERDKFKREK